MGNKGPKLEVEIDIDGGSDTQIYVETLPKKMKIGAIKKHIEKKKDIPVSDQRIRRKEFILNDKQTLEAIAAHDNNERVVLNLERRQRNVDIRYEHTSGEMRGILVEPTASIASVKKAMVKEKLGIPFEKLMLRFGHKTLFNDYPIEFYTRIDSYEVKVQQRLENQVEVFAINNSTGRTVAMLVQKNATILELKEAFQETEKFEIEQLVFKIGKKVLNNTETLLAKGIKNQTSISYELREFGFDYSNVIKKKNEENVEGEEANDTEPNNTEEATEVVDEEPNDKE